MSARRAAAAIAAVVLGCSGPEEFALSLSWSPGPTQECPMLGQTPKTCADIPVSCDAVARLRVVDTEDGAVLYTACFDVPATGDMCGLRELTLPPDIVLPNRMVRVQLAIWAKDQLRDADLGGATCPAFGHFDARGYPQLNLDLQPFVPTPAIGREVYFPIGDRELARLELGCSDVGQLDTESCRNRNLRLDVALAAPPSFRTPTALVDELSVRFGATSTREGATTLPTTGMTTLNATTIDDDIHWTGTVPGPLDGLRCVQAQLTGGVPPTATCRYPVALPSGDVAFTAYLLEAGLLNQIEAALGRELPDDGVVIGFVVDRANAGVAGAQVSGLAPGPEIDPITVLYPNADYTGLQLGGTNPDGVFVSLDAAISAVWHAQAPGLRDAGAFGGAIKRHVTAVVLPMEPAP